jgi:photosystem II stability/assembly factor-like uncharacterized protein
MTGFVLGVYSLGGSLFKTEDMGNTWLKKVEFQPYQFTSMTFLDQANGFIAGFDGTSITETNGLILRTQDSGYLWTVTHSLPGLRSISFSDALRGFACGVKHILQTYDAGVSWSDAGYSGGIFFNSIYAGHGKVFAVGENGAMVLAKYTTSSVANEKSIHHSNAYPNPTTSVAKVMLPHDGSYEVELRDALGRAVRRFSTTGSLVIIEKADLPAGAYEFIARDDHTQEMTVGKIVLE